MREAVLGALRPVKNRLQAAYTMKSLSAGLLVGSAATLIAGLAGVWFELPEAVGYGLLAAGPLAGLAVGLAVRKSDHAAASAVDSHYELKDRSVTALAFSAAADASTLHALQVTDAVEHLAKVEPKAVVPSTRPRTLPAALAGLAASAAVLAFWPSHIPEAVAGPAPAPEHIVAVGEETKAGFAAADKKVSDATADIEDEKAEDQKKALKDLFEKLAKKAEELTQPGTNEREALAKLSEMSADLQQMMQQLNAEVMDGQMSNLGTALAAVQAFEGAGKMLQEGNLEKAAKELDKLDEPKISPKEAKALEEKLRQMQKQSGEAGAGALSDALGELADSLKGGKGSVGKAAKGVAKQVSNAAKRKKVKDLLLALDEELKESKSKCNCNNNGGAKIKQPSKSNSPSSNWGRGISGNVDGAKTTLNGKRNEVQITGTPGEGDSDVETTATPEARQAAGRAYKEKYEKAKKESEAVLESEPLPLNQRALIKKYFELIRPNSADATPMKDKDAPAAEPKK